eukprot:2381494-Prymnesium_polylepis.1
MDDSRLSKNADRMSNPISVADGRKSRFPPAGKAGSGTVISVARAVAWNGTVAGGRKGGRTGRAAARPMTMAPCLLRIL